MSVKHRMFISLWSVHNYIHITHILLYTDTYPGITHMDACTNVYTDTHTDTQTHTVHLRTGQSSKANRTPYSHRQMMCLKNNSTTSTLIRIMYIYNSITVLILQTIGFTIVHIIVMPIRASRVTDSRASFVHSQQSRELHY